MEVYPTVGVVRRDFFESFKHSTGTLSSDTFARMPLYCLVSVRWRRRGPPAHLPMVPTQRACRAYPLPDLPRRGATNAS